ncbi:MAG: N-acetylmuramoyl-L-alanine amidase [Terriglobia bacterium]
MTKRTPLTWRAALLASFLASLPFTSLFAAAWQRNRAKSSYETAVRMRTTLASRPEKAREKSDYEKLIRTYRAVHYADPTYSRAPFALAAVAEVYAEMGRRFQREEYYQSAIQAYRYLIAQYPGNGLSRDALFTIGETYRADLDRPEEARKAFQEFIDKYGRTAKAVEARQKLKEIEAAQAPTPPPPQVQEEKRRKKSLPEVTAVRRWVGPNYSRIVVNVESEIKFESTRVPNPDRIVLDLANTRLSSALVGKTFPVEDGFLRQVRIGQYQPTVTRVVLDVEKIEEYSVFTLPNPFRLVIDINGPSIQAPEKIEPPKSAKSSEAPQPEKSTPPIATASNKTATEPPAKADTSEPKASVQQPEMKAEAESRETKTSNRTRETASAKLPEAPAAKQRKGSSPPVSGGESPAPIRAATPTQAGSRTLTRALGLKIGRIVIDPGHGGHDTGTIGPTGLCEKDVVLDVALRLKKLLESNTGAEVVLTRSDDTFIPLEERTAIANEKGADLFISVHANASRDKRARGIETYYLNFTSDPEALEVAGRENATTQESVHELQDLIKKIALTEKIEESQDFALQIQREVFTRLRKATGQQKNRGIKKAPFVVLIGAKMPSVLAEISFLTNPQDERLLKKTDHRARIAEALYRGIEQYVNNLGGVKVAAQARASEADPDKTSAADARNF